MNVSFVKKKTKKPLNYSFKGTRVRGASSLGPHTIKGTSKPSRESWAISAYCRLQGEHWDPQQTAQDRTPKAIFYGMHWGPLKMHSQRPCRTIKPWMGNVMQIVPFLTSVLYWWKRKIRPLGESWKSITHREYVY